MDVGFGARTHESLINLAKSCKWSNWKVPLCVPMGNPSEIDPPGKWDLPRGRYHSLIEYLIPFAYFSIFVRGPERRNAQRSRFGGPRAGPRGRRVAVGPGGARWAIPIYFFPVASGAFRSFHRPHCWVFFAGQHRRRPPAWWVPSKKRRRKSGWPHVGVHQRCAHLRKPYKPNEILRNPANGRIGKCPGPPGNLTNHSLTRAGAR